MAKILFYGYGNPGRQDDALGICFIERLRKWVEENKIAGINFDSNYQLNIEDADTISEYDIVFFVDASTEQIEKFEITEVEMNNAQIEFTMHAISPGVVLSLCKQIYGKYPQAYLIHIKGYEWELEFNEELTENGKQNLTAALEYIQQNIRNIQQDKYKTY